MTQILTAIYFLPTVICVIWAFIYLFRVKTASQKLMLVLQVLCVFYYSTLAFYISPYSDYDVMATLDLFDEPLILVILALDLAFIVSHSDPGFVHTRKHLLLYIPAVSLSSAYFVIYYLAGIDGIARFDEALDRHAGFPPEFDEPLYHLYYDFTVYPLSLVMLCYILTITFWCVKLSRRCGYRMFDVFRFFFVGFESTPTRVICFLNAMTLLLLVPFLPISGMGRSYLLCHPALGVMIVLLESVALFSFCYVEYVIDLPRFTLSSLSHLSLVHPEEVMSANVAGAVTGQDVADGPAQSDAVSSADGDEQASADGAVITTAEEQDDDIRDIFLPTAVMTDEQERVEVALRRAFDEQRVYLDPNLSIIGLASQLNTNRTTLSLVIGMAYKMNFRQLVASYRVELAKRFMQENPEAKQEEIAMECGFSTAQAFNQKFKELTGDAPRMWMVKQSK